MNQTTTAATLLRTQIAVIDDDIFVREAWALLGHDFDAQTFESPEEFLGEIERNPGLRQSFDAIIVDFDFGMRSQMSGVDLAAALRSITKTLLILSTDRQLSEIDGTELFDLHLDKNIFNWQNLGNLIPVARIKPSAR